MDWLDVQLNGFRERGMQVWLSGHVPPAAGNCTLLEPEMHGQQKEATHTSPWLLETDLKYARFPSTPSPPCLFLSSSSPYRLWRLLVPLRRAFAPVPRHHRRSHLWSHERRSFLLDRLALPGQVRPHPRSFIPPSDQLVSLPVLVPR